MFTSKTMFNVQLNTNHINSTNSTQNQKLKQTFDQNRTSSYSVNKRNSHPMFQHPIQKNQNKVANIREIQDVQLSDCHKKFLQQFKQNSYIIEKNHSLANQTQQKTNLEKVKENMQRQSQLNQNTEIQQNEQCESISNQKVKLASRFSKIDQLSEQYLSSKGKSNSQTLKFSQQKAQFQSQQIKSINPNFNSDFNQNFNQNIKLVRSQVIDLEKTTKNYHQNSPNKRKTLQSQPNVQPYQTTSYKEHRANFKFLIQILKDLKMLKTSQTQMHPDVVIQIGKNRFQQMKQNGKWETIKQYVEYEKILKICQDQQKQIQGCQNYPMRKKSSFRSNKTQLTTSNVMNLSNVNKKVKVISPQTISQFDRKRQLLQKQLIRSTEILTHGFSLKKYCFNRYKIQKVKMVFSFDFCFFALKAQEKFNPTIHSMSEFVSVVSGCKSKNFKRYNQRQAQDIPVDKAFTITFSDRTFDFVCSSMGQRDEIVHVIKLMKNAT